MGNRKPVGIIHQEYSYLCFDSNGQLDPDERKRILELGRQILTNHSNFQKNPKIIQAKRIFKKRQFSYRYSWRPNHKVQMAILNAVFSDKMKASIDKDTPGKERRSGGDRRQLLDIHIPIMKKFEFKRFKERRRHSERRLHWKRISNWASIRVL